MSDPSERPHLEAVRDPADPVESAEERLDEGREEGRRRGTTLVAILVLALIISVFVIFTQARQSGQLQDELAAMGSQIQAAEAALADAEADVALHEARLNEVRGSVGELMLRLGALQDLVETELAGPAPASQAD